MAKATTRKNRKKPKILVIDVDRDRVKEITARLRKEGFAVAACSTPRGALGQIRRDIPDAVMIEIILPYVSGFEIAARMQADPRLSSIPIFFTTDIQNSNGEEEDYFSRPFPMPALIHALKARIASNA